MSLCISLAALLSACGGGDADSVSTPQSADDGVASANMVRLGSAPINKIVPMPGGLKPPMAALPAPTPGPVTPTGTMSVEWVAPTTSADGLKMADLAGFHIYYGTASGTYTNTINVPNPSTLSYTISGLPSNTYYVVVKAYDSSENESSPSVEVTKAIR
jgi:hypothetical protein